MRCNICGAITAGKPSVCGGCGAPYPPQRSQASQATSGRTRVRRQHHGHRRSRPAERRLWGMALIAVEVVLLVWAPWVGVPMTLVVTIVWIARAVGIPELAAAGPEDRVRRPRRRS